MTARLTFAWVLAVTVVAHAFGLCDHPSVAYLLLSFVAGFALVPWWHRAREESAP